MMRELGTFGSVSSLKRTRDDIAPVHDVVNLRSSQDGVPAQDPKTQVATSSKGDAAMDDAQKTEAGEIAANDPKQSVNDIPFPSPFC
jgi:hypothetical protein